MFCQKFGKQFKIFAIKIPLILMSLCINPNCPKPNNPDNFFYCQGCGSELVLAGRYRVTKLLSDKGGFGKTYEVKDGQAIKVLKVLINNHPHAVKLFQQEAQVLCQLDYSGIPKGEGYFNYFSRDIQTPLHCLLMEKIEGIDLEEYQKQRNYKSIEPALALDWLIQLSSILHEVHRRNFFHRDIKPSNIILQPDGQLVLIDFGAARQVTQTILVGAQNTRLYTSGYAPPEQERGYAVQQSDFYALGRTFVYLLTGKEPNDSAIYDFQNNILNWRKYAGKVDYRLANFIDAIMSEKVSQRPENTSVILQQLEQIRQELYPQHTLACLPQVAGMTQATNSSALTISPYGGFWRRWKASLIDNIIVIILAAIADQFLILELSKLSFFSTLHINLLRDNSLITYCLIYSALGTTTLGYLSPILLFYYLYTWPQHTGNFFWTALVVSFLLGFVIKWFYCVSLESSCLKATIGKLICRLVVLDKDGRRISLKRANKRYWGKLLSTLTLYIGFMLAGWTKRKRALHDFTAGTFVVKK
jgi:serine/threonine protein kinase